ncbi:MAG: formylglycine-generating enzyme family protein [Planctomycetes bacterium]|nr:formylglycine-generating enzyme family protein [Planctomycetota bacterium]
MGNLLPEGGTDPACEFVLIPAGEFLMGSKELQNTQPVHKVSVPSFFMARMPVIRLVWDGCSHMRYYPREKITTSTGDRRPIEGVSWEEIGPFLKFTGLRLPTESEWEYACRAGTTTRYSFGEDAVVKTGFFARKNLLAEYAWYGENSRYGKDVACAVHPVGQKLPNAFGLCEMHGNVWELCEDTYAPNYNQHPTDGSAAIGVGCDRVTRGGSSWSEARALASAWRQSFAPPRHLTYGGFRVAARP